jgi:hypothetical protein
MKIKSAKLAQALPGESSLLLEEKKHDLEFDKGMLYVVPKNNPKKFGPFIVFPANIAYIVPCNGPVNNTDETTQEEASTIAPKGKPKK